MIDISMEDARWQDLGLEALAERAFGAALGHLGVDAEECEISLLACNDARIAELNAEFREKDKATNVLSWPAEDLAAGTPGGTPLAPEPDFMGEIALGDIAIAYETCAREAAEAGKELQDHCTHLLVHGVLHLLGYDHISDEDAALMEGLETAVLGKMGIADPYMVEEAP